MKDTISDRISQLERLLQAIKAETRPMDGHNDPGAIADCWAEVDYYIDAIKSAAKKNVYTAWLESWDSSQTGIKYDELAARLGTADFKYLKGDNIKGPGALNE